MAPKKQLLTSEKAARKKRQTHPETEDDFLDAGVKEEEGGGKWAAGDAIKANRFYQRALDIYTTGLTRYPRSFNLAFNKARLQYHITQQPSILSLYSQPLVELLQEARESHRYALSIAKATNSEVLFNTGQATVSYAEAILEDTDKEKLHDRNAVGSLLSEAIDCFQKCLEIQRKQLLEAETVAAADVGSSDMDIDPQPPTQSSAETETEETWAIMEETVTRTTLLDTCIAELEAWAVLIPLLDPRRSSFHEAGATVSKTLDEATSLISTDEQRIEYQHTMFRVKSALAEQSFKSGLMASTTEYASTVYDTWTSLEAISSYCPALCDYAEALIGLSSNLGVDHSPETTDIRWQALNAALKSLAQANTNPGPADRIIVNEQRGNTELLRARLAEPPFEHEQALKHRTLLFKNAETYYEGAAKLAIAKGDTQAAEEMRAKSLVAGALREGNLTERLATLPTDDRVRLRTVMNEMAEEGLITS